MIASKLVQIFSSLTEIEINRFQDFVSSPFFNKKQEIVAFASYFKAIYPNFNQENMDKKLVFSHLFPNQAYNEKKLGYLMSDTTKVLRAFITEIELHKENKSLYLAKSLLDRNLDKLFNKEIQSIGKLNDESHLKGVDFFYENYRFYEAKHLYFEKLNIRKEDKNIHEASLYLDYFYAVKKLRHISELVNRAQVLGKEINFAQFDPFIEKVKQEYADIDIFKAYLQMIEMQTKKDSLESYINLKKIITNPAVTIPKNELNDFYKYAVNYCIRRIKLDKDFYQNEALQLYIDNLKSVSYTHLTLPTILLV